MQPKSLVAAVVVDLGNLDGVRLADGIATIGPGVDVYEGMIVGEYSRDNDLNVNICREKKLTNIRAAGRDENIIISPHREMGLEEGIEWIADDELVEVTPESIRLRKKVLKQTDRPRRRQAAHRCPSDGARSRNLGAARFLYDKDKRTVPQP